MNVLFLSYWNLNDPLTAATVFPSLEILQELSFVKRIAFVNTEREHHTSFSPRYTLSKIKHYPVHSKNFKPALLNKIYDFILFPKIIRKIISDEKIDFVVARGAPAGSIAYLLFKRVKIPFLVESFEPHADYMIESGIWKKYHARFWFQKFWERQQKKYALGLMPVTLNYKNQLIKESVDESRIRVVPCGVNEKLFSFDPEDRTKTRGSLHLSPATIVGIYAGKFDGLYLAEESFKIYSIFFKTLRDFYLIILSPNDYHSWIKEQIHKHKLPVQKIIVKSVDHNDVGKYCSASDFAFATYKPGPSKRYLSPVKIGEYWMNGLPVFMTHGIGDESTMMQAGFGGVLFKANCINDEYYIANRVSRLVKMIRNLEIRREISNVAVEYRSFEKQRLAYLDFFQGNK